MRILFPDVSGPGTGKGYFLQGLVAELKKLNMRIVFDRAEPHDISFENIRIKNKVSCPIVVRFDGVYHDSATDFKRKNASMQEAAARASAIICQSHYGKRMVMKYLNADSKRIAIINNGSDPDISVTIPEMTHKHNFIAVAVWRPHKRLRETIEGFLAAGIPDSVLRIFGRMGKGMDDSIGRFACGSVVFMDHIEDRSLLLGYMRAATAMLHLCWFDCCPNSVVEAINQKCPVICSNEGGTHELVYPSNGIVLQLDQPYDYEPVDLYHPPAVNIKMVAEACCSVASSRPEIVNDHVNISTVAWRYKNVFDGVLAP